MAEPKAEPSEAINLVVKDQTQGEVHFKVKRSTKLDKVFQAYAQKKSIEPSSLRFLFDGARLVGTQTPADLDMQDEDVIDVMTEQVGGGRCMTEAVGEGCCPQRGATYGVGTM